jgi:hypothetical protein
MNIFDDEVLGICALDTMESLEGKKNKADAWMKYEDDEEDEEENE